MNWPVLSDDLRRERLQFPVGRVDMVLDTDTFNEVDDQFALSYLLLRPDRINLQAVYAAPFLNTRSVSACRKKRPYNILLISSFSAAICLQGQGAAMPLLLVQAPM